MSEFPMKRTRSLSILRVQFSSAINQESMACFYRKVVPRLKKFDKLELYIDSFGGEVAVALGLAHFLTSLYGSVTTYNNGHCDSAAIALFASGTKRVAIQGCQFAMHEVGIDVSGIQTLTTIARVQKLLQCDTARITQFLERRTGRAAALWKHDMYHSRILSANMAVRSGLATNVEKEVRAKAYWLTIRDKAK